MAEMSSATGTQTTVTDRRPVPQGVLPRGIQTWVMAGIAGGMVLIIFLAGLPEPAARMAQPTIAPAGAPNPDRLRDYQDRLRITEARAAQEAQTAAAHPVGSPVSLQEPVATAPPDPIVAERRRREYDSLFASNLVVSRRPDGERLDGARQVAGGPIATNSPTAQAFGTSPSVDQIADAVVRATVRAGGAVAPPVIATPSAAAARPGPASAREGQTSSGPTGPISAADPLNRILEGTIIDTVLTNRLDGGSAAPVNCLVTNAVYSHSGQRVVIPAGARVLGETKAVQAFGETRLAVAFHRVLMPDGSTFTLDRPPGLNQIGDAGLRDQVNQHYWSTFGAAAAVGFVSGLSQFLAGSGLNAGDGNRTVVIAGGTADATSQAALQVMNRFLNRLPTITIREGHRVKVYLTSDLELPAYNPTSTFDGGF